MAMPILLRRPGLKSTVVSPIGLDIGPRHVRAAQLQRAGSRWKVLRLNSWSKRELEIGRCASEGFGKRIRRSLEQAEYQGRRVTAGLSVPEVETHALEIPNRGEMESPEKFTEAVRRELQRVMNVSEGRKAISYWRLPASAGTRTTVIGVAADQSEVDAISKLVETLGLECDCIDAAACALARLGVLLRRRPDVDPQAVWAVLDVGYRMLRLVVCVGETPVLVRTLGNGGQAWTESVAGSLEVSTQAAEIHKRDHGIDFGFRISDCGLNPGETPEQPNPQSEIATMIYKILSPDLDLAVTEIERSYEYIMRCYPDRKAAELLLVGGGSDMKGLDAYLTNKLGVQVRRLDEMVCRSGHPPDERVRRPIDSDPGVSGSTPLSAPAAIREPLGPYACAIGLAIELEPSG